MRKVDKNTQDIDFVITWVDGNDLEWKREKAARLGHTDMDISVNTDDRKERYRDWDNLRYWFRGMEKYAPWVRKVHFVTWGHIPQWLNTKHPKLNIVCHEDFSTTFKFMPKPRRMTAHCSIFLEVNLIPSSSPFLVFMNTAMTMPARMAMTAPPMMGNIFPRNQEGTASSRQNANPFHFFCNDAISFSSSYSR